MQATPPKRPPGLSVVLGTHAGHGTPLEAPFSAKKPRRSCRSRTLVESVAQTGAQGATLTPRNLE